MSMIFLTRKYVLYSKRNCFSLFFLFVERCKIKKEKEKEGKSRRSIVLEERILKEVLPREIDFIPDHTCFPHPFPFPFLPKLGTMTSALLPKSGNETGAHHPRPGTVTGARHPWYHLITLRITLPTTQNTNTTMIRKKQYERATNLHIPPQNRDSIAKSSTQDSQLNQPHAFLQMSDKVSQEEGRQVEKPKLVSKIRDPAARPNDVPAYFGNFISAQDDLLSDDCVQARWNPVEREDNSLAEERSRLLSEHAEILNRFQETIDRERTLQSVSSHLRRSQRDRR